MLSNLFPRLTADPKRGTELFAAITERARARHGYVEGEVPDTLDGRFAMLATVAALALVRLERDDDGQAAAVALTERFIEVLKSEHRELGLGDPKLGRTVRKLVGALARRTGVWREAIGRSDWEDGARDSLYGGKPVSEPAVAHAADRLRALWERLLTIEVDQLVLGKMG
jgi:cytochrome b pre-mRNA-processing protein 3